MLLRRIARTTQASMFGHDVAGRASAVGREMAKQAGGAHKDACKWIAPVRR